MHWAAVTRSQHVYEVRPRKDHRLRPSDLRCAAIRSAVVWRAERNCERNLYAQFYSCSHDAVIRIYDDAGNVIDTHEHKGDSKNGKEFP